MSSRLAGAPWRRKRTAIVAIVAAIDCLALAGAAFTGGTAVAQQADADAKQSTRGVSGPDASAPDASVVADDGSPLVAPVKRVAPKTPTLRDGEDSPTKSNRRRSPSSP